MHIITVKWGSKYNSDDVNKLYNKSYDNFYCMTDDATGLNPNIKVIDCEPNLDGVWNKLALFKLKLGKLLYLDLDVIIQNDLTLLYDKDSFTMIKCYWKPLKEISQRKNHIHHNINSSVMVWNEDENIDIWDKFMEDPEYYMLKYHGIDHFIWWEGFTSQYWDRGLIYSKGYGIDADSWYNPGRDWYKEDAIIQLLNGDLYK
jgi:hypothetical protein